MMKIRQITITLCILFIGIGLKGQCPSLTISSSNNFVCAETTISLSAAGYVNYTWTPGNYNTSTISISPTISTVYSVTAESGTCISTGSISIVVFPKPLLTVNTSTNTLCAGESATLYASNAASFQWLPGGSTASSLVVTPGSTSIYTVIGYGNFGCSTEKTVTINVAVIPTLVTTMSSPSICSGATSTLAVTGATDYSWAPVSGSSATFAANPSVTTTYSVTGWNGPCVQSETIQLIVYPNPTVSIIGTQSLCSGKNATIYATGALNYTWFPGSLSTSVIVVSPTTTTQYTVTGTGPNGCTNMAISNVSVFPTPTIVAWSTPTLVCSGPQGQYTVQASGADSYAWGSFGIQGATLAVSGSSVQYVVGTLGSCTAAATTTVQLTPTPTVTLLGSIVNSICLGSSSTLQVSGASTYSLYGYNGIYFGPTIFTGNTVVATPTINTTYFAVGISTNGCISNQSNTLPIQVYSVYCIAAASASTICAGQSTNLSALLGFQPTFTWMPGPAFTNPYTASPTATTIYTIFVTAYNGCMDTRTVGINVLNGPGFTLSPSQQTVCQGNPVNIIGTGATSYTWMPGSIIGSSITINPSLTTTYSATAFNGTCAATNTIQIAVNPKPLLSVSSLTAICSGQSLTMIASGAYTYTWQPGLVAGSSITVSPLNTTTYSVSGSMFYTGCTTTTSVNIVVKPSPTLILSASSNSVCQGTAVFISASGATTYTWINTGSLGPTLNIVPSSSTIYTVQSANLDCFQTKTLAIGVLPKPTVQAVYSSTSCEGTAVTINAVGAQNYTWHPNNSTGQTFSLVITSNLQGTLIGTDNNFCTDSSVYFIAMIQKPVLITTGEFNEICSGESLTLSVTGANAYTWNPPANSSSIIVAPTSTAVYSVVGQSSTGCLSDEMRIHVAVSECTSLRHIAVEETFKVYPIPFSDELFILNNGGIQIEIILTDPLGKIVEMYSGNGLLIKFNTMHLTEGVYILKANTSEGFHMSKKLVRIR